ncbi:hypothetical protein RFI_13057, partial [Reticulomyxa filosa]
QQHARVNATANDMYHVLLAGYLWKMLQVLLGHAFSLDKTRKTEQKEEKEEKEEDDDEEKKEETPSSTSQWMKLLQKHLATNDKDQNKDIVKRLCFFMLPFLRKCYLLFYSAGLVPFDFDLPWSCLLVDSTTLSAILQHDASVFQPDRVMAECDAIYKDTNKNKDKDKHKNKSKSKSKDKDNKKHRHKPKKNSLAVLRHWTHNFFDETHRDTLSIYRIHKSNGFHLSHFFGHFTV